MQTQADLSRRGPRPGRAGSRRLAIALVLARIVASSVALAAAPHPSVPGAITAVDGHAGQGKTKARTRKAGKAGSSTAEAGARAAALRELVGRTRKAWEAAVGKALSPRQVVHLRDVLRRGTEATLAEARAQASDGEARVASALLDAAKELRSREKQSEPLDQSAIDSVASIVVQNVTGALSSARQGSPDLEAALDQARSDLRAVGLSLTHEAVEWVRSARPSPPSSWTTPLPR
jgi:hypothetical protein